MNIQKTAPTPKLVTMIPADPQMTERDLRKSTCELRLTAGYPLTRRSSSPAMRPRSNTTRKNRRQSGLDNGPPLCG